MERSVQRLPVLGLIAASLFFTGITFASTLNYAAIVGIDTLGIPNAMYSLLLMASSVVGALASVLMGYISDKLPDRRYLVILSALMGALGFGLIFVFRNQAAFITAMCVIMPFGGALFSQTFSFARAYNNVRNPARAEFLTSVLRTIFSVAWAIVPPIVGWIAATTVVFNIYGIAALAYLACAAIFALLLLEPTARVGRPAAAPGVDASLPRASIEPAVLVGIAGVALIFIANTVSIVAIPLLITVSLKASFGELGIYSGIAAAMELPFMILWGYLLRWISKHTMIVVAALVYALYLWLASRATSVTELYWLQLINGPAAAALLSIPISYLQEAIKGRVGLSTSLLDVVNVIAALTAAALFGAITATAPNYPLLFVIAAGIAVVGAAILFAAHRVLPQAVPATSR